jgi:nucleoside-diphosphate-sugar epimerase
VKEWAKQVESCSHEYDIETCIACIHNFIGPLGTWEAWRKNGQTALYREISVVNLTGNPEIDIWGNGEQTRSFSYIDDLALGVYKLMRSDCTESLNIGQDRIVAINELVDLVAGNKIFKKHILEPQGVRGCNSDNTRLRQVLSWEPPFSLEEGLARPYAYIEN